MNDEDRKDYEQFARLGADEVRLKLGTGVWGERRRRLAIAWLSAEDAERKDAELEELREANRIAKRTAEKAQRQSWTAQLIAILSMAISAATALYTATTGK